MRVLNSVSSVRISTDCQDGDYITADQERRAATADIRSHGSGDLHPASCNLDPKHFV